MSDQKNVGGRPRKEIDYDLLEDLCRIHCTGEECCDILGMCYDTLNTRLKDDGHGGFSDYYKKFASEGKSSLRRLQWKNANDGNVSMQIWLGKQLLGQTDKSQIEQAEAVEIFVRYGERNKDGDDGEANKET